MTTKCASEPGKDTEVTASGEGSNSRITSGPGLPTTAQDCGLRGEDTVTCMTQGLLRKAGSTKHISEENRAAGPDNLTLVETKTVLPGEEATKWSQNFQFTPILSSIHTVLLAQLTSLLDRAQGDISKLWVIVTLQGHDCTGAARDHEVQDVLIADGQCG